MAKTEYSGTTEAYSVDALEALFEMKLAEPPDELEVLLFGDGENLLYPDEHYLIWTDEFRRLSKRERIQFIKAHRAARRGSN